MALNAEKFLDTFNHIEKHLKSKFNKGYYMPFGELVRKASAKEGVVKRFKDQLFVYADLRNVMVHNTRINGRMIAEPFDDVVHQIEQIWIQIQHPEKVSKFNKKVYYCFSDDKLLKALQFMHEHKISQVPILEKGEVVDVLNANQIADWLAVKEIVSPSEITIREVLQNAHRNGNFEIISGNMSVFDAAEIYKNSYLKPPVNWYYDALIMTPSGKANDLISGIIVLKDIAQYISVS